MYIKQIEKYNPINEQEENDKKIILKYIDKFPNDILLRQNEAMHITSSSMIFNKEKTKVLMIHHNIYRTWSWTGGHVDGDCDLLYVALKEAKEETGLENIKILNSEISSIDILPVWGHYKKSKYVSAHLHLNTSYIFEADDKELLKVNIEETSGVKWIDINKISEFSNEPELIVVYNKLISKALLSNK
ncbi:NUDIX hydrolase [Helicovermis profundi]|uniref:NUDIX hydrolase n=1 Tax=Helicovermis profundi TaxID=3065157 RepID=A0AAU9EUL7_9FIRM|nr:NUDIX hydrolase [Clostridia bacterium S502]